MENTILEIFTLVTGIIYIILEIRQKNAMWIVGILTSIAAMAVFFRMGLYASFGLNTYYLITSFIGLWQWRKDKSMIDSAANIHINRLTRKTVIASIAVTVIGICALTMGMELMSSMGFKENPMSVLDASVAVLSAVATWWLVRAHLEQWWLWIVADTLSVTLCLTQGMWWMALLYIMYVIAAVIGLIHWKKHGEYVHSY